MPFLSEFPGYGVWGDEAERWVGKFYNQPVRSVIDYFTLNLNVCVGGGVRISWIKNIVRI